MVNSDRNWKLIVIAHKYSAPGTLIHIFTVKNYNGADNQTLIYETS